MKATDYNFNPMSPVITIRYLPCDPPSLRVTYEASVLSYNLYLFEFKSFENLTIISSLSFLSIPLALIAPSVVAFFIILSNSK